MKRLIFVLGILMVLSLYAFGQEGQQGGGQSWEQIKKETPNLDSDHDGMPDWWEIKYGLNPHAPFDANLDLDGDKIKNKDEYKISTDPKSKTDADGDGLPDDWEKFYKVNDPNADPDGDGMTNLEEFQNNKNPNKPDAEKKEAVTEQKHPTPSMAGVRENIDSSVPDNHQIAPNVWQYNDPIGDDKGPGYYTYPTDPVYVQGGFDIVKFVVDASSEDYVVFKVTVNADLKQDWGMEADFDIQHVQIYIDMDRVPGSGHVACIPGLNIFFNPESAWDKAVIISPQPLSRVRLEVDIKAPDMSDDVVLPISVPSGKGRTLIATVKKKDLGIDEDTDISKFGWQVVMQSNEGFPDPEDVLTRNVNEYRGLHRFGGGSDYWGDPELMDIIMWPARGTLQEAKDQFEVLNVWQSYPDPTQDIKAVVPLVYNDQKQKWMPPGGYKKFARLLSQKMKPKSKKDKYVSDNFTFAGSVNIQWYYNIDSGATSQGEPASDFGTGGLNSTFNPAGYFDNSINSRFTLEFYGKVFTDILNFYARLETWWGPDSRWDYWQGNFNREFRGPQYVPIDFQAFRFELINPLPMVNSIAIGNYQVNFNPWTIGGALYPDRDKFKGIFISGSTDKLGLNYVAGIFYPFPWLKPGWSDTGYTKKDYVAGGVVKANPVKGLKTEFSYGYYTDKDTDTSDPDGDGVYGLTSRLDNTTTSLKVSYDIPLVEGLNITLFGAASWVKAQSEGDQPIIVKFSTNYGYDTNSGKIFGYVAIPTVEFRNILGTPVSVIAQGFYIKDYHSMMAARGDFANAASHDVLLMYGNQSAHDCPQDMAVIRKWWNETWESVTRNQWKGLTLVSEYNIDIMNVHLEGSYWEFNAYDINTHLPAGDEYTNLVIWNTNVEGMETAETQSVAPFAMRFYGEVDRVFNIGNGLQTGASLLFNRTRNWWPDAPWFAKEQGGMSGGDGYGYFTRGFDFYSYDSKVWFSYQWSKVVRTKLTLEYRWDKIFDLYPNCKFPEFIVAGKLLHFDFKYTTPLGDIRSLITAWKSRNDREIGYAGVKDKDFRIPIIYLPQEWGLVALTELDIHF